MEVGRRVRLKCWIDCELYERIGRAAYERGISISRWVCEAVEEHLEVHGVTLESDGLAAGKVALTQEGGMMNRSTQHDAEEFGLHLKQGGWRLGLLVARNVEKGRSGANLPQNARFQSKSSKVTAAEFARESGTTAARVLRYYLAWELAAVDGHVPHAADLKPGQEIRLNAEKLPPWFKQDGGYYTATGEGAPANTASTGLITEGIKTATPMKLERIVADPEARLKLETALRRHDLREDPDRHHLRAERPTDSPIREAVGGFASMGIAAHLEQATEDLRELVADGGLNTSTINKIEKALESFTTEFNFARQMAGV